MTYHGKLQIKFYPSLEKGTEFSWNLQMPTIRFPGITVYRNRGCHVTRFLGKCACFTLVSYNFRRLARNRRMMVWGYTKKRALNEIKYANRVFKRVTEGILFPKSETCLCKSEFDLLFSHTFTLVDLPLTDRMYALRKLSCNCGPQYIATLVNKHVIKLIQLWTFSWKISLLSTIFSAWQHLGTRSFPCKVSVDKTWARAHGLEI